jgi:arylformamidase
MPVPSVRLPGVLEGWESMSAAQRDAAYNNTAAVPEAAALRAARAAASVVTRGRRDAVLDLPYGPGPRHRIDLFPAVDPAAPCLVFVHGGYWQMNSKEGFACLGDGVRAHGWATALPGYTLAPDATLAQIVAEVDAALSGLAREGPAHGIAGPLVVAGWSAGGHLAALALRHERAVAGLAISGLFELEPLRDTYLNQRLLLSPAEIADLSPLRLPVLPKPLAIAYGTAELPALVDNSRAFHAYRARHGAPGVLLSVEGCNHFSILDELQQPTGVLTRELLRQGA